MANGNLAIRHMGVPTVTVPMGLMADTGMPMGLTFAGRGWDDLALLDLAARVRATGPHHGIPPRTPPLRAAPLAPVAEARHAPMLRAGAVTDRDETLLLIETDAPLLWLTVDGEVVPIDTDATRAIVRRPVNSHRHSQWMPPWGPLVVARFTDGQAAFAEASLPSHAG